MRKVYQTVKADAVQVKVYRDSEWEQYIARLYYFDKLYAPADAFDTDKASIIATAEAMLNQAIGNPTPAGILWKGLGDRLFN